MSVYVMLTIAWGAGLMAVFGAFLAHIEGRANTVIKKEFVHGVTAFGGGILMAAVAFALVPEGMKELNAWQLTGFFAAGGVTGRLHWVLYLVSLLACCVSSFWVSRLVCEL